MNTREIASEYRLSHWAQVMKARQESGQSIRAFCENEGLQESVFYYWQRKLREAAYLELNGSESKTTGLAPQGFVEAKLIGQAALPKTTGVGICQLSVETAGMRITADGEYPVVKIAELLRMVMQPC